MSYQLKDYFECQFRIGFSTQHCLLAVIEKLRKSLDNGRCDGGAAAALLTDLSKAFDCMTY